MAVGTTRGAHLGGAYVTVDAEVGGFGGRLISKLRTELKAADATARTRGREMGKELADGILQGFMRRMPGLRRDIEMALKTIRAKVHVDVDVDDANVNINVDHEMLDADLSKAAKRVKNTGRQIQRDVTNIAGGIIGKIATVAAGLSKTAEGALLNLKTTMGSAKGNAIALAAAIYAIYAAILTAMAAFNALGREITNILKLGLMLPGLLATIAAVAIPMTLVFSGLGDEFQGIFDADPKKAKEALDKLSGSVKEFAKELRAAKPWFDDLVSSVRESFFKNITGMLTHFVKNFGPIIKAGFTEITGSVGALARNIFEALSTPETQRSLEFVFDAVNRILNRLSGPGSDFFIAMRNMVVASMPAIERLFDYIGKALEEFSAWINKSIESGSFDQWLNDGINTLKELYDLAKEIMGLLGVLFDEGNQDGESFIVKITDMIRDFKEFADSPDGKLALDGIALAARIATLNMEALLIAVWAVTAALADMLGLVERTISAIKRMYHEAFGYDMGSAVAKGVSTARNIAVRRTISSQIGHFADGGIINEPTLATFAESGPEAAIPLNNPSRARQLLRESGLDRLVGGHAEKAMQVNVYIGNEQLDGRIYTVSQKATDNSVTSARFAGLGGVNPE